MRYAQSKKLHNGDDAVNNARGVVMTFSELFMLKWNVFVARLRLLFMPVYCIQWRVELERECVESVIGARDARDAALRFRAEYPQAIIEAVFPLSPTRGRKPKEADAKSKA